MEKCMVAASVAFLLCHPNSNTKCSNCCKAENPSPKKRARPKPKPKQQESERRKRSPQVRRREKGKHLELKFASHLHLIYERVEPNKYSAIGELESILRRGWATRSRLVVDEVLKVKHHPGVVAKFEKYREMVIQKASNSTIPNKPYYDKLMDDGFELLCFIGSKLGCGEISAGLHGICKKRYCGVCQLIGVIESSALDCLHSVSVSESAWMAHQKAIRKPGEGRKALMVCRVIAGRVADHRQRGGIHSSVKIGEDDHFDSVFVPISDSDSHDELLVFNPCSLLPCFVVLYDIHDLH